MGESALVVADDPKRNMFTLPRVFSTDQEREDRSLLIRPALAWAAKKLEENGPVASVRAFVDG